MKGEKGPDEKPVEVKLPKVFGIRPGVYLSVIYALVVIALLFVLLLLPGIKNPGEKVTIDSLPPGAAVLLDGRYIGATPLTDFIKKGSHSLILKKKGYQFDEQDLITGGRLFASLFAPKKSHYEIQYRVVDSDEVFADLFSQLSGYALIDTYRENYQAPPLITPVFSDMVKIGTFSTEDLYDMLYKLTPNISNETILHDFYYAFILLKKHDGIEFASEREGLSVLIKEAAEATGVDPGLLELSFGKAEKPEAVRVNYSDMKRAGGTILRDEPRPEPSSLNLGGIRFASVSGGSFMAGDPSMTGPTLPFDRAARDSLPIKASVSGFYMAAREVTVGDYRAFLREHPEWTPEKRDNLMASGAVDEEYLSDWAARGRFSDLPDDTPLSGVSWFAAQAFCQWLEDTLPASMRDSWEVRLPSETEWELAALRNGTPRAVFADTEAQVLPARFERQGKLGIADLEGNLWEWTANWYLPLDRLYQASGVTLDLPKGWKGAERVVRGGSWANRSDLVSIYEKASQEPQWCTPFLGFRPVIAAKPTGQ
ncbi:SUMF1/EgtB/PvdO family nonheme iron enzyme [Sediminispirochaeta bajacaliforniensis]|uniref:SUMF1/EgtB/PvdO family nonheme iron enzyme n=1 Tax=Sediminispirochaeta bajacaliforniensis TaxID=148 RepID=UPI00035EE582|nr:SUMF1/EgtB/PvdO family nonheme iron enzyme [Sediminispirochaeta bajacaliforniensis]